MAMKSVTLITVLIVVLAATQAKAQLVSITGTVPCSVNASVNGTTPTPPFPNATVALSCGGRVIATTMTNNTGMFNIRVMLNQLLPVTLSNTISSCRLVVLTPLSTCNATLPSNGNPIAIIEIAFRNVADFMHKIIRLVIDATSWRFTRRVQA